MNYTENVIVPERTLLVSLDTGEYDAEESLRELWELAKSGGAEPIATMMQKRPSPETATCVGSGMVEEIRNFCENNEIELIIFDRELTPTQIRNLENATDVRVVDRTMLILDIFAQRAQSRAGKVQVEAAQLKYLLPRLTGKGTALSRLGGGIGTRGPGESKLESDRRHIRRRIDSLRAGLRRIEGRRLESRKRRQKDEVRTVAIVGYTNAGKSTLLNRLTDAGVLAEDKLFATLDTTARGLQLPDGRTVLLVDTVGLIRRLPHHLVQAFHATLEEAATADLVLNLCDASSPDAAEHLAITGTLLSDLGRGELPVLQVFNKCDRLTAENADIALPPRTADGGERLYISAKTGEGIDKLLAAIAAALPRDREKVTVLLPFSAGALAETCRREGAVESEEYVPEGLRMTVTVDKRLLHQLKAAGATFFEE